MGLTWLSHPVLWHTSRVSSYDYSKMTDWQAKLIQAPFHSFYRADWDFARTTVCFFCAGIGLVLLYRILSYIKARSSHPINAPTAKIGLFDQVIGGFRYTSARQFHTKFFGWYSPSLANMLTVGGIFTFTMALMLGPRPYYWPNPAMGDSQPIATRSGWISLGIMPFMIAFAAKVNPIGFVTGTSHEKLQVFHRWTALAMYITSLVHTFPFIVRNIKMGMMEEEWTNGTFYWTGVAALVPQTFLVATSWGPIRNRYYETFKKLHYIAAGIFMAALFIHVNFMLTSWDYFWATGALFGTSFFIRLGKMFFNSGGGLPATVQQLPGNLVSVSVKVPKRLKWSPGQHIFIRFLDAGVHAFSSHPFTIASLPSQKAPDSNGDLELVFKRHGGITSKLYDMAAGKPSVNTSVIIDGPYGGVHTSLKRFDRVCLLAGGTGAAFILPVLKDLVTGLGSNGVNYGRVDLIIAVPTSDSAHWMKEDFASAQSLAKGRGLTVHLHVTRENPDLSLDILDDENKDDSLDNERAVTIVEGRPDLQSIIRDAHKSTVGSLAVVACGPDSFIYDVRNAAAACQLYIMDGFGDCKELYLHTEKYGW